MYGLRCMQLILLYICFTVLFMTTVSLLITIMRVSLDGQANIITIVALILLIWINCLSLYLIDVL